MMQNENHTSGKFALISSKDLILLILVLGLLFATTGWFFQCRVNTIEYQIQQIRSNENK